MRDFKIFIGLIGNKKAGKTTVFEMIKEEFPDVVELTLAGPLKDCCAQVSGVPRDHFDSHEFKERSLEVPFTLDSIVLKQVFEFYGLAPDFEKSMRRHLGKTLHTPRQIAQYIGTDVLRTVDEQVHCRSVTIGKSGEVGVITDIRFPNELEYFSKGSAEFSPFYVKRTAAEIEATKDSHASEAYIQEIGKKAVLLDNNKSVSDLRRQVEKLVFPLIRRTYEIAS